MNEDLGMTLKLLPELSKEALEHLWASRLQVPFPSATSLTVLRMLASWHLQSVSDRGLPDRLMRKIARCLGSQDRPARRSAPALAAGTEIVRSWGGRTHRVQVTGQGFTYEGTHFKSLTQVAKRITGGHISGPRFFDLYGQSDD